MKEVLLQMIHNEARSIEVGMLLRNYATPEELETVRKIVEQCKLRHTSGFNSHAGTLLVEFMQLASSIKK